MPLGLILRAVDTPPECCQGEPRAPSDDCEHGHRDDNPPQSKVERGATWELHDVSLGEPFSLDPSGPVVGLAATALAKGFGSEAVCQGVGGSIPFISQLAEVFPQAQILVTGIEDPDTRAHSPNESLDLRVLWRAILSEAVLLSELNRREISDLAGVRALD